MPKTDAARRKLATVIGADGRRLLQTVGVADVCSQLTKLPEVGLLERVWGEHSSTGMMVSHGCARCYKVHFTESCDPEAPRLITNGETTPATTPDAGPKLAVARRHRRRKKRICDSTGNEGWSLGPASKESLSWLSNTYPKNGTVFEARFARRDYTPCASRPRCTRAKRELRIVGLQTREHHDALQTMRSRQTTDEFRKNYAARAGIESTNAQAIRRSGLTA